MYAIIDQLLERGVALRAADALLHLPVAQWQDGRDSAGPQARQVKSNLQLAHDHPLATEIRERLLQALDRSPAFLSHALPARIVPPRINRYDPGHPAYGWHVDNAVRLRSDHMAVRTDLSCTVMLSDADSYAGGELAILDGDAHHRVRLQAGDAVLYPSTRLHEVRPVTQGVRLACFFWVQSLVPDDEKRRLLRTLDTNLLALRERLGESVETTALTGVYHGLLRHWARP